MPSGDCVQEAKDPNDLIAREMRTARSPRRHPSERFDESLGQSRKYLPVRSASDGENSPSLWTFLGSLKASAEGLKTSLLQLRRGEVVRGPQDCAVQFSTGFPQGS